MDGNSSTESGLYSNQLINMIHLENVRLSRDTFPNPIINIIQRLRNLLINTFKATMVESMVMTVLGFLHDKGLFIGQCFYFFIGKIVKHFAVLFFTPATIF